MLVQVVKYSLIILMIEDEIEHKTVDASIITSSKPSEFFCTDCSYAVGHDFSSFNESVKFFNMAHQVTHSISSFSECLELFFDFCYIFVSPSDVLSLAVSDVRPPRTSIYLFVPYLRVLHEFVTLHFPEMHDETHKQIAICNDHYKVVSYSHSILQEFVVKMW